MFKFVVGFIVIMAMVAAVRAEELLDLPDSIADIEVSDDFGPNKFLCDRGTYLKMKVKENYFRYFPEVELTVHRSPLPPPERVRHAPLTLSLLVGRRQEGFPSLRIKDVANVAAGARFPIISRRRVF